MNRKVTTCSKEAIVDQRADTAKKDTEVSTPQQRIGDATNIESKSSTSTWIKFDIVGKHGVKLPSLALVDLKVEKSFMSYETWVLSGQPTLDKAEKTIQTCGKSSEECLGMVHSSININSQPLEGEFFVMTPKHLQKDLVLGRQLAKSALDLQKSQAMQGERMNAPMQEDYPPLQTKTGDCSTSLEPSSSQTTKGRTQSEDQCAETSSIKDDTTKLDTTRGMHQETQAAQA